MKLAFALFCLLSVFITKGYALTCISCSSSTKDLCTGPSVTCSANEVCTTIYTVTSIEVYKITTYALVRGCGQSTECNQPKTLSNQFMTVNINTGCCTTDNCSTTEPPVSTSGKPQNGLVCPSCFDLSAATCVPSTEIQCTGNETRCTTYSMSTTTVPPKPVLGMAGCATENLCVNSDAVTSTSTTGEIRINITCSKATKKKGSR
ncbi:phospholipase A2 inhibitor NAI-like isoform X2 [Pyxicephalus adspersus]|uniref:phospholipase A2 inhibitor NAI-like isoform X2 n=1 Tax=Pyxicephalus adspersus TaxID=30357 RepID=UPI003B5A925B